MIEAEALNSSYDVINEFAKIFGKATNLSSLFDIKEIIKNIGGNIIYVNTKEYEENFFMQIKNNIFNISILKGVDEQFERLLLIQAIGHYLLHGSNGKKDCNIVSSSKGEVAKEGFLFSLSLLLPDEQFIKIRDNFDDDYISKLFRVPIFAVQAKRKIVNKIYLKEIK